MRRPRGLNPEEAELWARVARTVVPMRGRKFPSLTTEEGDQAKIAGGARAVVTPAAKPRQTPPSPPPLLRDGPLPRSGEALRPLDRHGLDGGWERRLAKGALQPDFTLDLHGATLDAAHARLDHGLSQAWAQGARVLLLITGRARPVDGPADRGSRRGAIRAKFLDWLTLGPHASRIAAVRPAHPRHGGAGAVYLILKRPR